MRRQSKFPEKADTKEQKFAQDLVLKSSREAAKDYSPRRKPWVADLRKWTSPVGAKETIYRNLRGAGTVLVRQSRCTAQEKVFAPHEDTAPDFVSL
jgi:hypothetical protein